MMSQMVETAIFIKNIFKYEFFKQDDTLFDKELKESAYDVIKFLKSQGVIKISDETGQLRYSGG